MLAVFVSTIRHSCNGDEFIIFEFVNFSVAKIF